MCTLVPSFDNGSYNLIFDNLDFLWKTYKAIFKLVRLLLICKFSCSCVFGNKDLYNSLNQTRFKYSVEIHFGQQLHLANLVGRKECYEVLLKKLKNIASKLTYKLTNNPHEIHTLQKYIMKPLEIKSLEIWFSMVILPEKLV